MAKYVFVGVLPICIFVILYLGDFYNFSFSRKESKIRFVIGVLSARDHFRQREIIRQTWLKALLNVTSTTVETKAIFVIGNKDCSIHPHHRKDLFTCEKEVMPSLVTPEVNFFHQVFSQKLKCASDGNVTFPNLYQSFFKGFSFRAVFPVKITSLGILKELQNFQSIISVSIFNAASKELICKVVINENSIEHQGFVFEKLKTSILLPKNFVGLLIIELPENVYCFSTENFDTSNSFSSTSFLEPLRVYNEINDFYAIHFQPSQLIATALKFQPFDNDTQLSEEQSNSFYSHLKDTEVKLLEESKVNNDILFVDHLDIYRNLPVKIVKFFSWAHTNLGKEWHALKTDDDCYLNIRRIIEKLRMLRNLKLSWWGNFRKAWMVDLYGKWAENDYTSPVYPWFACGTGYFLGSDIVSWLHLNRNFLKTFQGEDVSLGIWLSAVKAVNYIEDFEWKCDFQEEKKNFLSLPQLDFKDMSVIHEKIENSFSKDKDS